ncbi:MAG: GIY-YIG nuclease family protein [Thermomicrobiales bacterium]|nr:GIY-YIG nuclease family protein [Thermomicrobiales bacterium]MCO5226074.1 GIY-YIG nuclease family protein [Thermomicrobiales bacterium]MCO5229335.1 GIY-YIG nuclease family protein [Thermomicrobiales bacterium]
MQIKVRFVYIMANKNRTIYTGVTSDLHARVWQHKYQEHPKAFTAQYACDRLVYYAEFARMDDAIAFEKYVKGKSRG